MNGYVKLPYEARSQMRRAKRLRLAAKRVEKGLWREHIFGALTVSDKALVYEAARDIRRTADRVEKNALCR